MNESKVVYDEDTEGHQTIQQDNKIVPPTEGIYARRIAKNGRELYFLNGRLIAKDVIPETAIIHEMDQPAQGQTLATPKVVIETEDVPLRDKQCIAGDGPGQFIKFINGQMVSLCEEHYNQTTGEITQLVNQA